MFTKMLRAAVLTSLFAGLAAAQNTVDRDGDGISDPHEEILGTDPTGAETLRTVFDDGEESASRREQPGYDATKDLLRVEFGHVAGNRCLWRATFAQPPRLDDTVFHLYVDADANSDTGRKGPAEATTTGTDYMLSVVGGRGTSSRYDADGNSRPGPVVNHVVDGNSLLVTADVDLVRGAQGLRLGLYVLCHTTTGTGQSPAMSDSTREELVSGIAITGRAKIIRPRDSQENFAVDATFGLDIIRPALAALDTIVVPHDELQRDGFEVDLFTSRRWPHLVRKSAVGRAMVTAPKPGRYHVGFLMYDDSNDERIGIFINGKLQGVAVARQDNNQEWLFWLREPYRFSGGESIELRAEGPGGKHGIANIVFLPAPPEVRRIEYRVDNTVAVTQPGPPVRTIVSWTTTWPCSTQFEYGETEQYGRTVTVEGRPLVHRVFLTDLEPGKQYHGRAVAATRDGATYAGTDFSFIAAPAEPPAETIDSAAVPLSVKNMHSLPVSSWPVATGVPFPQGQLADPNHVRLVRDGQEVPVQVALTGRWRDGSVKWLLVNFQADAPASGEAVYQLEYGRTVRRAAVQGLTVTQSAGSVAVDTGTVQFGVDKLGRLTVRPFESPWQTSATEAAGGHLSEARAEAELTVEESGPLRAVLKVVTSLVAEDGRKPLRIEKRIEAFRGLAQLRVHHTIVVQDAAKFTELNRLELLMPQAEAAGGWTIPLAEGEPLQLEHPAASVWQQTDSDYIIGSAGATPGRLAGAIISERPAGYAVAVRDLWQNYPLGFSLVPDGLAIMLCPPFKAGFYDQFPFEKEGHQLYYYLLGGRYRFKRGMAKTHELMVSFEPPEKRRQSCELFERPPLVAAPPEWYCRSKAFYDVAPRNPERFGLYEEAIDRNIAAYQATRQRQRDFGLMNYGDWYGERGSNWGNVEYDTPHALFLEYIRSGNPDAFLLGCAAELHHRDVDTVHWGSNPNVIGAVYIHQMGHVGGYYDQSVPGTLGFPESGHTVSHAWSEGHFAHYFLTGDRRSYETGAAVADYFTRQELGRPYDFSNCREPGWHLIMLSAAYAATGDPYYLNAARIVTERVLETQDVDPRPLPEYQAVGRQPFQQGGWSRMLVPGHCECEPRHRGNAGFMVAVLLSGLKYYHDVTGDPRVKESIIRGAYYLLDETYSDEVKGFRYTSCPNTKYSPGASPLMVEGIARAYLWTRDERFRRVLIESLPLGGRGSGYGKGFSMYYRMAPRVLADLEAAGITLNEQ